MQAGHLPQTLGLQTLDSHQLQEMPFAVQRGPSTHLCRRIEKAARRVIADGAHIRHLAHSAVRLAGVIHSQGRIHLSAQLRQGPQR
ncbi:MAG TPA: hypothetical protein VMG10_23895 [Gemmataceae bacterium]|nr:hypothetical protein [Gemmataceae bacterium]